ncbi:MAG: AsmA family protein [Rhodospirillaceae bacterium]|nr:AsmA family protein [Rhodospirillaceae bacterium]MBT6404188.1 AsmA family protein [Rhodospirillaceae bacterium]MBT7361514.1 AsmA family protein [Rhodospirillaceae bacterium]
MRLRTILKISFVVVVTLVVAIIAVVFNLDPNDHKERIAAYVARETGRTLTVEGPMELEWGRTTRIAMRDVSLSNPAWAQSSEMVRITEVDIRFELLPLLRGRVDIASLILRGAQLNVETDSDGRSSFEFGDPETRSDDDEPEGDLGIDLEIAELEVEDVRFSFLDGPGGPETVGTIERIKVLPSEQGAPLDIDIAAEMRLGKDTAKIDLDGRMGSWNDIIRGDSAVPFDLTGEAFGLNVEVDGDVRAPNNPSGFDVDILISGDAFATIQPFFDTPLPQLGHISLSANISGGQRNPVVKLGALDVANIHVTGTTKLALSGDGADHDFDLKAELRGQGLAPIEPMARISLAQIGAVKGTINITGNLDALRFEPNRVAVADSFLSGTVTVGPLLDDPKVTYDLILTAEDQTLDVVEPIAGVSLPDFGPIKGEIRAIGDLNKVRAETTGLDAGGIHGTGRVDVSKLEADVPTVTLDLNISASNQSLDPVRDMLGDKVSDLGPVDGDVGVTGTLPDMRLTLKDFAVDRIKANGDVTLDVDEDQPLKGYSLDLAATGQALGRFQPLLGVTWPQLDPVDLTATVEGDLEKVTIDDFTFRSVTTDLFGHGSVVFDPEAIEIEAVVTSDVTDLTRLFPDYEPARAPDLISAEEAKSVVPAKDREKVFSDEPLPLKFLRTADIDISFQPKKFVTPYGVFENVNLRVVLEEDALNVRPLEARYADSDLRGDFSLDARGQTPLVGLSLRSPDIQIGQLFKDFANLDVLEGSGAIDIALSGSGNSIAAIAGSLDGHARQLMGKGRMRNEGLGYVSGLFSGIGEALGGKSWVAVDCMANDFEFKDGVATSRVNLLSTEVIILTAEGSINLGSEDYKMKVKPRPRGFDLSLAVPVLIRGPLDDPSFLPDPLGTLAKIGSFLGAIVFPPAALIGLIDLGGNNHPCVQYAKQSEGKVGPTLSTPLGDGSNDRRQRSTPDTSNETER